MEDQILFTFCQYLKICYKSPLEFLRHFSNIEKWLEKSFNFLVRYNEIEVEGLFF